MPPDDQLSLREYQAGITTIEKLLNAKFETLEAKLKSVETATVLRAERFESWLRHEAEVRERLRDTTASFITRSELLAAMTALLGIVGALLAILHFWK
jgi:hypothetical protein